MNKERLEEENLRLGIKNIQGLFLERYPEFDTLFPRTEDNKITEDKREEARRFIMEQIGTRAKFRKIFGPTIISSEPTFSNSVHTALIQTFEPWGIEFNPPTEWVSNKSLAEEAGKDPEIIRTFANRLRQDHPDSFRVYRGEKRPMQFYSPQLVSLINQELSNNELPSRLWVPRRVVAQRLKRSLITIRSIAEEFRKDHPDWFRVMRGQRQRVIYYSPELEQEIRGKLNPSEELNQISPDEANEQLRKLIKEQL